MKILHRALEKSLEEFAVKHAALSEDRLAEAIGKAIKEGLPSATKILSNDLRAKAPEMLREHRELEAGFRTRNFERWREGLDLLQMLIVIAEEAGSDLNREFRPQAVRENNLVFETVCSLHSRAVLVAREVLCLLEGGFADGALARWRSLHELAVVSGFLSEREDNKLAERYLLAGEAQRHRLMVEYQNGLAHGLLAPLEEQEIQQARALRDGIVRKYGAAILSDYGWAAEALGRRKLTFRELEQAVGLGHLRPYFKWACEHIHAGYKPPGTLLGTCESQGPVLLSGQSNSGLTEPAAQTALSLAQVTAALLSIENSLDHVVISQLLLDLVAEVQETFARIESETLKRARARANPA